jgi:hypothetical protein
MDRKVIYSEVHKEYWVGMHHTSNAYPVHSRRYNNKKLLFRAETEHNDEETYVKNFANPMASVSYHLMSFYIERTGDKLSIKIYDKTKTRLRGTSYFKQRNHMWFYTVNVVTGDFYAGKLLNYQNKIKRTRVVRRNCFYEVTILTMLDVINNFFNLKIKNKDERDEHVNYLLNIFKYELMTNLETKIFLPSSPIKLIYLFYLTKKGIKYPNNVYQFTQILGNLNYLPTMKEFKKCNMKYVDAFMLRNNLKGDKVKKILHEVKFVNLGWYRLAVNLFGTEWVHQDSELMKKLFDNQNHVNSTQPDTDIFEWSLSEKKKCFNMFHYFINESYSLMSTFIDHIKMINYLKNVGEDVKWEAKDIVSFTTEHEFLTELKQSYMVGKYTRIYSDGFINEFKEFNVNNFNYTPIVLRTSDEYNEESSYQRNCVRGYVDRASSFVISLRQGEDRATIEYEISISSGKYRMKRVQSLGKHNIPLSESWLEPLDILDKMVDENLRKFIFVITLKKETKFKTFVYKLKPNQNGFGFTWVDENDVELSRATSSFFDFLM